jgi:hypothetical protein
MRLSCGRVQHETSASAACTGWQGQFRVAQLTSRSRSYFALRLELTVKAAI